jgi:hypothetical protein
MYRNLIFFGFFLVEFWQFLEIFSKKIIDFQGNALKKFTIKKKKKPNTHPLTNLLDKTMVDSN